MNGARVGLLFGGDSAEREVSLKSGAAVAAAMQRLGIDFIQLDGLAALQDAVADAAIDRVFNVLHGGAGENGMLQGYLAVLGLPVTGAGVLGCALSMDKARCKAVWQAAGIPVARHVLAGEEWDSASMVRHLGLPLVVKPVHEGSSVGISLVRDQRALDAALAEASRYDQSVMVERFVDGPEYTAAMVGDTVLPMVRVETPREFYDYHAKYHAGTTLYHCPAGLTASQEQRLAALCREAFQAAGVRGWGRVDFMLEDGEPVFLEINTAPGMTDHSLVPMAAKQHGWSFDRLVQTILDTSEVAAQ
jgi:D-alanine-D-alanine ligase